MSKAGALVLEKLRAARLGDKVESVTRSLGIKPCGGCKKRKAWLNGEKLKNNEPDKPHTLGIP